MRSAHCRRGIFAWLHTPCGSGLARDGSAAVKQEYRAACIASKPAPTGPGYRLKSRANKNARQSRAFCIDLLSERGK
ncbi:hypothetical protein C7A07_10880 [Pseudomonas fragi]|nr:hypothetical protein C7A07_10880 [Pseudomonas fragi]